MSSSFGKTIKYIDKVTLPIIRSCPGAKGHICCNYIIISQILGCPFNCSYCYLHTFWGREEIVIYRQEEKIVKKVENFLTCLKDNLRIGTGEFSDSLALQEGRSLAQKLVKIFSRQNKHLLELKTKSDQIDFLLNLDSAGKTVVAWSVNPEIIIKREEHNTASLSNRINAAEKCVKAGYQVAFHFDPIIYFQNWEKEYEAVLEMIFEKISPGTIAWISLGALRFPQKQKQIMRERFRTSISFDYFERGRDGKLRYPEDLRAELFSFIYQKIRKFSSQIYVYLCMETESVWQKVEIKSPNSLFFKFSLREGTSFGQA